MVINVARISEIHGAPETMFELNEEGKIYARCQFYGNDHWNRYGGPSLVLWRARNSL